MKNHLIPWIWVLLSSAIILSTGCKSGKKNTPGSLDEQDAGDIVHRIETMKQVYHLCPSPAEMLSTIDMSNLDFKGDLLNPVENKDSYLDTRTATLALGVYITDLAYSALFGRHEETLDYLEAVEYTSEQVRLSGAIDEDLIQKARDNVDYLDSLYNISNEAFINLLYHCERNNRSESVIMLSAGAFIESLYLTVNLVETVGDKEYVIRHIAEQKYALENLLIFAESLAGEDENIAELIREMQGIKEIYDEIELSREPLTVTTEEEVGQGQPRKLVLGSSSPAPKISPQVLSKLKEETIRLRNGLIEG